MLVDGDDNNPAIDLRFVNGRGHITGVCASGDFFRGQRILDYLTKRLDSEAPVIWTLTLELTHIGSTAYPELNSLFALFAQNSGCKGNELKIVWRYRDRDRQVASAAQYAADKYKHLITPVNRP